MAVQHDGVRFGAAYYYEYAGPGDDPRPETLERDLDLMRPAGFTVIRVGESVWSTWEPDEGRFELDWLEPVLDGAHARGIDVVLGTPTYAVPHVAGAPVPGGRGRAPDGPADGLGRPAGDGHHAPGVPVPRRARPHEDRRAVQGPPRGRRVPGGQRARAAPAAQPRGVPAVRRPPAAHLRRRRDPQPGVGPRLLVAPAVHVGGPVDPRRQRPAPVRPGVAPLPGVADHRDHRLAGEGRARVRPRRTSSSPPASPTTGPRWRTPTSPSRPRRDQRERLLRDAGLAGPPEHDTRRPSTGRPTAPGRCTRWATRCSPAAAEPFLVTETNAQAIGGPQHQPPRLPGPVAAGRVGARLPRRPDGRVLALAHAALRRGDLLGRRPAPQRRARAGPTARWRGSAPSSRGPAGSWRTPSPDADIAILSSTEPGSRSRPSRRCSGADGRRTPQLPADRAPFYRGAFDAASRCASVRPRYLFGEDPGRRRARHPVLVAAGYYPASDADLAWLLAVRRGRRAPGRRSPDRVRRPRGARPHRGPARAAVRPRRAPGTTSSATSTTPGAGPGRRSLGGRRPPGPSAWSRTAPTCWPATTTRTWARGPRSRRGRTVPAGSPSSAPCPARRSPGRWHDWLVPTPLAGWADRPRA